MGKEVVCAATYRNDATFLHLVPHILIHKDLCGSSLINEKKNPNIKWLIKNYPINNFSSAGKVLF